MYWRKKFSSSPRRISISGFCFFFLFSRRIKKQKRECESAWKSIIYSWQSVLVPNGARANPRFPSPRGIPLRASRLSTLRKKQVKRRNFVSCRMIKSFTRISINGTNEVWQRKKKKKKKNTDHHFVPGYFISLVLFCYSVSFILIFKPASKFSVPVPIFINN